MKLHRSFGTVFALLLALMLPLRGYAAALQCEPPATPGHAQSLQGTPHSLRGASHSLQSTHCEHTGKSPVTHPCGDCCCAAAIEQLPKNWSPPHITATQPTDGLPCPAAKAAYGRLDRPPRSPLI